MDFDIDYEINKVVKIINDDTFDKSLCTAQNAHMQTKQNYLLNITTMTMQYPKVEIYLKDLLIKFSIDELQPSLVKVSTLCGKAYMFPEDVIFYMLSLTKKISLNAWEIIIKHGININHRDSFGNSLFHHLFHYHYHYRHASRIVNILNLFIKYGADLSITNINGVTVLDKITYRWRINEEFKICIMILLDNGAKTNKPYRNGDILNFIESYRSSSIKPAIKK